jgi:hypothetical protein
VLQQPHQRLLQQILASRTAGHQHDSRTEQRVAALGHEGLEILGSWSRCQSTAPIDHAHHGVPASSGTKYERKPAKVASESTAAKLPGSKSQKADGPAQRPTLRQAWCLYGDLGSKYGLGQQARPALSIDARLITTTSPKATAANIPGEPSDYHPRTTIKG